MVDEFALFRKGVAMFEAEVEMERRSSILPLLLMMCLVAGIVGLATYVLFQVRGKTPLRAQDASGIVTAALQGPGRSEERRVGKECEDLCRSRWSPYH